MLLFNLNSKTSFIVDQGKGEMRTYWLLGEEMERRRSRMLPSPLVLSSSDSGQFHQENDLNYVDLVTVPEHTTHVQDYYKSDKLFNNSIVRHEGSIKGSSKRSSLRKQVPSQSASYTCEPECSDEEISEVSNLMHTSSTSASENHNCVHPTSSNSLESKPWKGDRHKPVVTYARDKLSNRFCPRPGETSL